MSKPTEQYEFGVRHQNDTEPHREGMTFAAAVEWIQGWIDDGGRPDAFCVIRRKRGAWEADFASSKPAVDEKS